MGYFFGNRKGAPIIYCLGAQVRKIFPVLPCQIKSIGQKILRVLTTYSSYLND